MMHHKVKPLGNRVVVKQTEAKTTKGGILLPDSAKEKPREGTVVAVGPGKTSDKGRHIPLTLKEGDTVLFTAYAGTEVQEDYLILSEDDILAVRS